jgi:predicted DCC family thiol-disulfide oxidoreductase YuxK
MELLETAPRFDRPVIVFDAFCVLCATNAQFVLKHDLAGHFLLASMQNEVGASIYRYFGIDPSDPDSFVVLDGGRILRDSDAVLAVIDGLGWPWRIAAIVKYVPKTWRDRAYLLLARNRYRIFGRREVCWLPSPEQARRVL